ncbi:hypothetical protein AA0481_0336 [Acetobacter orientalis NRIC 0481]|nr:hypothetical protein AA0481_0336 [Acetobacter orientalis NRIC 0481]
MPRQPPPRWETSARPQIMRAPLQQQGLPPHNGAAYGCANKAFHQTMLFAAPQYVPAKH